MTAQYRLTTPAFFAPNRLPEGTVINYDGEPGPHMEPLNAEAEAALDAYYAKHPDANLNPVENLPMTMQAQVVSMPTAAHSGAVVQDILTKQDSQDINSVLLVRQRGTTGDAALQNAIEAATNQGLTPPPSGDTTETSAGAITNETPVPTVNQSGDADANQAPKGAETGGKPADKPAEKK